MSISSCPECGITVATAVAFCGSIPTRSKKASVSSGSTLLRFFDQAADVDVDAADPFLRRAVHRFLELRRFVQPFAFEGFDHFLEAALGFAEGDVVADHPDHRFSSGSS